METWTGNSLARTEQNRIFAIIICIKYPLSADISPGSDVYKCQANDTFIMIDSVCPLYCQATVTIISLRSAWMSERWGKWRAQQSSSLTWAWYHWYFLLPTSVCCLSLSSWNFRFSFISTQTSYHENLLYFLLVLNIENWEVYNSGRNISVESFKVFPSPNQLAKHSSYIASQPHTVLRLTVYCIV